MTSKQIQSMAARTGCEYERDHAGAHWFVLAKTEYMRAYAAVPRDAEPDSLSAHEVRLIGLKARFTDADQA